MAHLNALRDSKTCGSRYASHVRVDTPQGSAYDGRTGIVARVHDDETVFVRFPNGMTLPFAVTELKVLR